MKAPDITLEWLKTQTRVDGNCWIWIRQPEIKYPSIFRFGKRRTVSHLGFFVREGRWPKDGIDAMHSCDNTRCVNPDHILEGTRSDNIRDMVIKGRNVGFSGRRHGEKSKKLISQSLAGKNTGAKTKETKDKLRLANLGKKASLETRAKMSESHRRRNRGGAST